MNILIPKLKIVEAQIAAPRARVEGYFTLEACNRYGRVTRRLGPWKQVITDTCMDDLFYFNNGGSGSPHARCHVGVGSPTFSPGSTGLASPVAETAATAGSTINTADVVGTDGYRETQAITKQFALGAVVANISEVGMFTSAGNTTGRFLDLIRDGGGSPTTFPVTADDQLLVTHILHRYPFLGTSSGMFTIGGSAGSGNHDFECNMRALGSASFTGSSSGATFGASNNTSQPWSLLALRDCTAIGAVTDAAPTGAVSLNIENSATGGAFGTPSNDGTTWLRTKTFTYGLTTANHANGISGFVFSGSLSSVRGYKCFVDPPIPKFAGSVQRTLSLELSYGITRV